MRVFQMVMTVLFCAALTFYLWVTQAAGFREEVTP